MYLAAIGLDRFINQSTCKNKNLSLWVSGLSQLTVNQPRKSNASSNLARLTNHKVL